MAHHRRDRAAKHRPAFFCFDTYTAIMPGTYTAAPGSASAALEGAEWIAGEKECAVYVMVRPPGHHAEARPLRRLQLLQ